MHDSLAIALAKGVVELVAVVLGQVVADKGLTAVLVHSLEDLVRSCVTETGEEREESSAGSCVGLVLEDDLVELGSVGDLDEKRISEPTRAAGTCPLFFLYAHLSLVAHQSLGDGVNGVEDSELSDTRRTCTGH